MITKTTRRFILTLVAAYLTLVRADELQEINCEDKDGYLCTPYREARDIEDIRDDFNRSVYTGVGVTLSTFIVIVIIITTCCFCACCPVYKYRNKGTVYASAPAQVEPVTVYQQPPYNPQHINVQPFVQPPYPGFVYSTATTQQQPVTIHQQPPYNPQHINTQPFPQPPSPGFFYPPRAPEEPPPYYQTSQQNRT